MNRRLGLWLIALAAVGCDTGTRQAAWEELEALRVVGLAHLEEQQPAEAGRSFARIAELAPEEPLGPANLAVSRLRQGELEAARRAAREAVEREAADPDVRVIAAATAAEDGDDESAVDHLRAALASDSTHVPALWALHEVTGEDEPLERLVAASPGNLPALLTLAEARLEAEGSGAVPTLERIEQLIPPGSSEARDALRSSMDAIARGEDEAALRQLRILHNLLRVEALYTRGLAELTGRPGSRAEPIRRFRAVRRPTAAVDAEGFDLRFERAGAVDLSGAPESDLAWRSGIVTDYDADADLDLVVTSEAGLRCLPNGAGDLAPTPCGPEGAGGERLAQAADFDGDVRADLLLVGDAGVRILYAADDGFTPGPALGSGAATSTAVAADFDHDGDLDVLAGGAGTARFFRQTTPGRFVEAAAEAGLTGLTGLRAATFGDLDMDGDLDLVVSVAAGVLRLDNQRHGVYVLAGDPIVPDGGVGGVPTIVDVNGDGWFDVLVATNRGLHVALGDGTGQLRPATRIGPEVSAASDDAGDTRSVGPRLLVEDFDLDGRLDALVQLPGSSPPVTVYRGIDEGRFVASAGSLPAALQAAAGPLHAIDLDGDGDLDLVSGDDGGLYVNQGGESNHALEISLVALAAGSGKVNRLGIGSRLDVWAGGRRQSRVVRGEVERIGLGSHERADVVRIEWTNGVPQNVFGPDSRERLVEQQVLKGSCAFLYAWSGAGFEFVTDFMWKSALGMPLGIMAGEVEYAPPHPSLEYVRIPPGGLVARDGFYELRMTEELWEVAYLDDLALLVVDHPAEEEVYVDEAFGEPTVLNERLYRVREPRRPERAIDHRGRDAGERLAARDFVYVGGFDRDAYQGVTETHALTLTLAQAAGRPATLYLAGWVHPTDASINVRIGQAGRSSVLRPIPEVPDGEGGWRTLRTEVDFPAGKNKTVVVELPEGVPEDDPRIRLRTNMEIYWDAAFYTVGGLDAGADGPDGLTRHRLEPARARLRERGFSRMYRRGGRYGPHWFDYDVVRQASPWRPLPGRYTRTGDVLELLTVADDRYVVFGPGDEIAVSFRAPPPPPAGRERTYFLYSDGFLKDADLNTRLGDRVGPLPRHGQVAYDSVGLGDGRSEFAEEYLTRVRDGARPPERPERQGTGYSR